MTKPFNSVRQLPVHFTVCSVLLLLLVWSASSMPVQFCQNTERQIEKIINLLQTIKRATTGTPVNLTKQREIKPISKSEQCALLQRLTNYQTCDLKMTPEIQQIKYLKEETKGLVDNLQIFKTDGCVLSTAVCPFSLLSFWTKIEDLLNEWSHDVTECNSTLQSMC
ncbi:hypothetical protein HF521_009069 [Silurus meridionalis]|uniref:Interleukin-2 n=1 Tax=Silurus meridionalis TaxID=175797 RepID=A0A8T0BXH8_SILME|nr:hypothetical protein HF521_009069 [Silurus meridionalis]